MATSSINTLIICLTVIVLVVILKRKSERR